MNTDQKYLIERIKECENEHKTLDRQLTEVILRDVTAFESIDTPFFPGETTTAEQNKQAQIDKLNEQIKSAKARAGEYAFDLINNVQVLDI